VLDFKLINSEGTISTTDFVPVATSLNDGIYDFNIKYTSGNFSDNILQYLFNSNRATHNLVYDGISAGTHKNILYNTEDLTTYPVTGTTAGNEQILEKDTVIESVLYETGAIKLGTERNATDGSMGISQLFTIPANTSFVFSIYVSYGDIESFNSTTSPTTKILFGGSANAITLRWDPDNDGVVESIGPSSNTFIDSFKIGSRRWHRIGYRFTDTNSSSTDYTLQIDPSGGDSAAKGYAYFCHPQVTLGQDIPEYYPNFNLVASSTHPPVIPELVAGPTDQNLTALIGKDYVIYEAATNKVFNKYIKGNGKIFLSAKDFAAKKLLIKDNQGIRLLKTHSRFPTILETTAFFCPTLDSSTLSIMMHPNDLFNLYVSNKDENKTWRLRFKKGFNITKKTIVNVSGGSERDKIYWNEKPTFLTTKLVKVSEKGLVPFTFDIETDVVDDVAENYTLLEGGLNISILSNYDVEISGIDPKRGLILFKYPPPADIELTYQVNNNWGTFDLELNPKLDSLVKELDIKIGKNGELLLEINNKGILSSTGSDDLVELLEVFDNYHTVGSISVLNIKPTMINLASKGGSIINTESTALDLKSHTKHGFMGIDPTEINILISTIPDKAIAEILYQFNDLDGFGLTTDPRKEEWDSATRLSRISLLQLPEEVPTPTSGLLELVLSIRQHTALGMPIICEDIDNNIIYSD